MVRKPRKTQRTGMVRGWIAALAIGPIAAAGGCASINSFGDSLPFRKSAATEQFTVHQETGTDRVAERAPYSAPAATAQLSDGGPGRAIEAPYAPVQTVSHEQLVASQGVSHVSELETNHCGTGDCANPTIGGVCGCGACAAPGCAPGQPNIRNVQEYIFDGGDAQPTVVIRDDWSAVGVDPTDTVMYYETLGGQVCVKPTNRVPIYAPRFGNVRQVRGVTLAAGAIGTERILAPVKPGRFDDRNLAGTMMQPLAPHGEEQVKLIDAFQENKGSAPVAQVVPAQRMSEARVPFEDVDVTGTSRITDDEIAVLGRVLANARTWFIPESLAVMIDGETAGQLKSTIAAQDVHVYEFPDKCAMRICKTASHGIADSGDIVSFTIRFDNSGVKPLGNAVIIDSLSPRLEYIEGSQQSSVDVRFSTEPNEVGSQLLRWEVVDPVEPSEGGVISFDCRVR